LHLTNRHTAPDWLQLKRVAVEQRPQEFQFDLSGGHLALDFANSVSRRDSPDKAIEHLNGYSDLVSFARQSGVLSSSQAESLEREAQAHSRAAAQQLRAAVALREATFRTFLSLVNRKSPSSQDVELIDEAARDALAHRRIVREDGNYRWEWPDASNLERIVWPIAHSAADLLTSPELKKVRECQASNCYWLFLDSSRNRSRRWCTMSACGNREKARRHYRRQRGN
jgi:predicted RNA-binding Zn ribbon-like protein